jgi:hypothetical protein
VIPAGLDHIFIDRSLGAIQVPALLRAAGLSLTTMREHYGESRAQTVTDLERETVLETGARLFCVPRADLLAEDLAARFTVNIAAIHRAAQSPGPFIYSVLPMRIVRLL